MLGIRDHNRSRRFCHHTVRGVNSTMSGTTAMAFSEETKEEKGVVCLGRLLLLRMSDRASR